MSIWQYQKKIPPAYISALLRFIAGIIVACLFGGAALIRFFWGLTGRDTTTSTLVLLAIGVVAGSAFIWSGYRTYRLLSRRRTLMRVLDGRQRAGIQELAVMARQDLSSFVADVKAMILKGYLTPDAQLDFNRKELILSVTAPAPAKEPEDDTYLEEIRVSPVMTIYLTGFTWLFYIFLFPLYRIYDYIIAALLSIAAYFISKLVLPDKIMIREARRIDPVLEQEKTGNADLDEIVGAIALNYGELTRLERLFAKVPALYPPVCEIRKVTQEVIDFIKKNPEKLRQIRQFASYYLPTAVKLLVSYDELRRRQVKGDNIYKTMSRIEGSIGGIAEAFRSELDKLYRDKALDISVDIDVLQEIMKQNGLGPDILDYSDKPQTGGYNGK